MDQSELDELDSKKKHLVALEAFVDSAAHKGFIAAREYDIRTIKDAILMVDPVDRSDEIEGFKLRGELRYAEQMVKTFEDALVNLKVRVDELVERQLEQRDQTKV